MAMNHRHHIVKYNLIKLMNLRCPLAKSMN